MERAASVGGPLVVEAEAGRLSGKLLILRLTALGLWRGRRGRRGGRRSAASSASREWAKDVLSQAVQRGESQIGVMRGDWAGKTAGRRTLAHGTLGAPWVGNGW
jgi:hypothetical protein